MVCTKTSARRDEKHLSLGFGASYIRDLTVIIFYNIHNRGFHKNLNVIYDSARYKAVINTDMYEWLLRVDQVLLIIGKRDTVKPLV